MKTIVVNGGAALTGRISVSGSKNAALPILFACIMTRGINEIENLPDIGDVNITLEILRSLGAEITRQGATAYINTENLEYRAPDSRLISKIRASTYLLGACLCRFGRCEIGSFGGCSFSARPIDMHLDACRALGAEVGDGLITVPYLTCGEIHFAKKSVGATVNAILLASGAYGKTTVTGCAEEPHIDALIEFLISCGGKITRIGDRLEIEGGELHGGKCRIFGDMIEAGSYLAAGIITGGRLTVDKCPTEQMDAVLDALRQLGLSLSSDGDSITAYPVSAGSPCHIIASPYPGFPTDLQPIFAVLLARLAGGSICDTVWRERFGYLDALRSFGIASKVRDNTALVSKSSFKAAEAVSPDLRGGMACLLSALGAEGQSKIHSAEIILRGYENLTEKFSALGADIKIVDA